MEDAGVDFTEMNIEMSERWRNTDKPLFLVHNFTEQRDSISVMNHGVEVVNNTLPETIDFTLTTYENGINLVENGTHYDPTADLLSTEEPVEETPSEQGSTFISMIISGSDKS